MASSDQRTQRLLGLLLLQSMKSASKKEKAVQLSIAGSTNVEIADLLQTSSQDVAQYLYTSRKRGKRKAK